MGSRILGIRNYTLVGGAIFGSVLLKWSFAGVAPVDVVLLILAVGGISIVARDPGSRSLVVRTVPGLWLFLLASVTALGSLGFPAWALQALATDIVVIMVFLVVQAASRRWDERAWMCIRRSLMLSTAIVVVTVCILGAGSYRPAGTFANPNYAAHWMAVTGAFLLLTTRAVAARLMILAVGAVVIIMTGSFAGMAMLLASLALLSWRQLTDPTAHLYGRMLAAVLLLAALTSTVRALQEPPSAPRDSESAISSARFGRSSESRSDLWERALNLVPAHPLGVGPSGLSHQDLLGRGLEAHNDYIALLVERGIVGAIGFLFFGVMLWRSSRHAGVFRCLVPPLVVGAMFRETLHFRHAWLLLALALGWDEVQHRYNRLPTPESAAVNS